jgi:isochorismate synthase
MHDTLVESLTEQDLLPNLLRNALDDGNAITLWRMPNSPEKHMLICTDGVTPWDEVTLEDSRPGFMFAPYDPAQKKMFFRGDLILTFRDGHLQSSPPPEKFLRRRTKPENETAGERYYPVLPIPPAPADNYVTLVERSLRAIREGSLEKVVPSRSREVELPPIFDVVKTFNKLCDAYPDAMVSFVSSEETGSWLGATPELIVSVDDHSRFRTVALAGTKRYEPGMDLKSVAWTEKEIEEQALVCRYIISCFKKIRVREYDERGPRTSRAGNLLHLKTEYEVDMSAINFPQLGSVMLKLLHPTSAVCGMPLAQAQEFLRRNEGYDRQYYSGYLGPVNIKQESRLFVNLRCMQLLNKGAVLYAGAGVTIDSIPEKEWEETELKFETLLSVIR